MYYKHKYGGIYEFIMQVDEDCVTKQQAIVYKHLYPFVEKTFVRNKEEFYQNFSPISDEQYDIEVKKDRIEFQNSIKQLKS